MPRRKPDKVHEHRITLGTWEREQVKKNEDAKNIRDIGVGVGVASVGIGGTYVAYKIGKALYDWGEDIVDTLQKIDDGNTLSTATKANPIPHFFFRILGL